MTTRVQAGPSEDIAPDPVRRMLGLEIDRAAGAGSLVVADHLLNTGGTLWGGCGLSAAIAVGEQVLGRGCLWATVQYVNPIVRGARLDLACEVGQHGRGLSQVAVRGTVEGRLGLLATGTFGGGRDLAEQFVRPSKDVPPPADCPERILPAWIGGMAAQIEQRSVTAPRTGFDGVRGTGRTSMWMRLREPAGASPSALAILADLAPSAISEAIGEPTFGVSLDNSIRIGRVGASAGDEWVLLEVQVEAVLRGVAQINARMFADDGKLLAIAGQSARMRSARRRQA